jgi:hypothetical protein
MREGMHGGRERQRVRKVEKLVESMQERGREYIRRREPVHEA